MQFTIESLHERIGDDVQQREFYSLNALAELESSDSPIFVMLKYWLDLRNRSPKPPCYDASLQAKFWQLKIPHHVTLIDCSAAHASKFRVLYHANDANNEPWLYDEPISGRPIGTLPSRLVSLSAQSDYDLAKSCETLDFVPYCSIRQVVNGVFRDYMRLLLPFTGPQGDVTMLAAVTRMRQPKTRNPAYLPQLTSL